MSATTTTRPGYRGWFLLDGLVTALNAVAYLALHRAIPDLLGGQAGGFLAAGIILAVVSVGLLAVAWTWTSSRTLPRLLAAINVVWASGSFALALANPWDLTTLGIVWVAAQGIFVLAMALLQIRALRASS